MASSKKSAAHESVEPLIIVMRNQRVILDADLARLYGVTTKALNQAVKRNVSRFPHDFAFLLTAAEAMHLRSRYAASNPQASDSNNDDLNRSQMVAGSNRSRSVTGTQKHRDPRFRPRAFTEHGAIMAANILRSDRAVHMSVFVVRAFVRLREHVAA